MHCTFKIAATVAPAGQSAVAIRSTAARIGHCKQAGALIGQWTPPWWLFWKCNVSDWQKKALFLKRGLAGSHLNNFWGSKLLILMHRHMQIWLPTASITKPLQLTPLDWYTVLRLQLTKYNFCFYRIVKAKVRSRSKKYGSPISKLSNFIAVAKPIYPDSSCCRNAQFSLNWPPESVEN